MTVKRMIGGARGDDGHDACALLPPGPVQGRVTHDHDMRDVDEVYLSDEDVFNHGGALDEEEHGAPQSMRGEADVHMSYTGAGNKDAEGPARDEAPQEVLDPRLRGVTLPAVIATMKWATSRDRGGTSPREK